MVMGGQYQRLARRSWRALALGLLLLGGALSLIVLSACEGEGDQAPNILIILADDLSWCDAGCYGNPDVQTPNIDRLAREGLRFTSGYTSAATCTPTRFSTMTGKYAWRQKAKSGSMTESR